MFIAAMNNTSCYLPQETKLFENASFVELWLLAMPLVTICFITIVANGAIIVMFATHQTIRKSRNTYILSLAVANFTIGLSMTVSIAETLNGEWMFGDKTCIYFLTLKYTLFYVTILSIILITVDRWWSVNFPFSYRIKRNQRITFSLVALIWMISCTVHVPSILGWSYIQVTPPQIHKYCRVPYELNPGFTISACFIEFFIPLIILLSLNMGIYIKLARRRNSKKIRRSLSTSDGKRKTSSESEGSLEKMDIITSVSNGNRRKSVMENILSTIRRLSYGHPGSLSSQNNNFHVQTYKSCVINGRSVSIDYASLPYHHGKGSSLFRAPKLPCLAHTSKDEADAAVRDFLLRQDNKALFALAMLVLTFVICWSPFILCKIIFSICPSNLPTWALQLSGWVLACSAALNPFLYGLGSSDFRKITQRFICGKKSITRRGTRLNAYNQVPHSYDMTGIKHCTIYTNRRIINTEPHSHA